MFSVVSFYDLSFNLYCNDCYEYDVRYLYAKWELFLSLLLPARNEVFVIVVKQLNVFITTESK